jgi:hypothetical protein
MEGQTAKSLNTMIIRYDGPADEEFEAKVRGLFEEHGWKWSGSGRDVNPPFCRELVFTKAQPER